MDIQTALRQLSEMHKKHGVIWTLGSGECFPIGAKNKYAGIATLKPESRFVDPANNPKNWISGNNIQNILTAMVKQAEKYVRGKNGR